MRVLPLSLALLALAPAAASAAPFGELTPLATTGDATCLRATGTPGELVRSSPAGARLMRVTASGPADGETVVTGVASADCPQVATRAGGAGVIAQAGAGLWVATRDPGADWLKAAKLDTGAVRSAVAVAPSGAAAVAWVVSDPEQTSYSIKAATRTAGGAWSAPAVLASRPAGEQLHVEPSVRAGIADDGAPTVLFTVPGTSTVAVEATAAPAGGAFAPAEKLGDGSVGSAPALAVAGDGGALAAFWSRTGVHVAERTPGGTFGAAATIAHTDASPVVTPAVALASGGAAAVAWNDLYSGAVSAAVRAADGAFGAPVALAHARPLSALAALGAGFGDDTSGPIGNEGVPPDDEGGNPRVLLTPDGHALLTWHSVLGVTAPHYAAVPLAGGHVDAGALGAGVRWAGSVTPLVLADGRRAAAWTDGADPDGGGNGRVHVAADGVAPAPSPPVPSVALGKPLDSVLSPSEALRLPVTCDAACDVRVDIPAELDVEALAFLPAAGRRTLSLEPTIGPLATAPRTVLHVRVRFSAPGAATATERTQTIVVTRPAHRPAPRVLGLRAARDGTAVIVTWRTDRTAKADSFFPIGTRAKTVDETYVQGAVYASGGGTRFRARLPKASRITYVRLFQIDAYGVIKTIVVKVR